MLSAYQFAEGGQPTDELILGWSVEKYGAQAVFGRTLSFHEIRMIDLANNVVGAYRERDKSESWFEWAETHHAKARILNAAGILAAQEDE